jgi:hypothetical protein
MFIGECEPSITFTEYVERLMKHTNRWVEEKDGVESFGVTCAILAVQYLERLDVKLCNKSVHRYFMAAYLVGAKVMYDYDFSNVFWGQVSGCSCKQVSRMEAAVCVDMNWCLTVPDERHGMIVQRFITSL